MLFIQIYDPESTQITTDHSQPWTPGPHSSAETLLDPCLAFFQSDGSLMTTLSCNAHCDVPCNRWAMIFRLGQSIKTHEMAQALQAHEDCYEQRLPAVGREGRDIAL
jgi:hypothetical protein